MLHHHEHQSLRLVKVEGSIKPAGTEWYECKSGCMVLVQVVSQVPMRAEELEAERAGVKIERSFVALDETTYESIGEARSRNRLILEIEELSRFLVDRTTELDNGDGYIQQDPSRVDELRLRMMKIAAKEFKRPLNEKARLESVLEDSYNEQDPDHPLFKLYTRLTCIDRDCREWQTKALADDPSAGKQVRLNPEVPTAPPDGGTS